MPLNSPNFMQLGSTPQLAQTSANLDVLKVLNKQNNSNLIDLAAHNFDHANNSKASVLEAFDPLCTPKQKPTPSVGTPTSPESTSKY